MNLYYQSYPDPIEGSEIANSETPIIIIPGLFGSTTNWRAVAKRLGETHKVMVIDQRNHGRSPHDDSQTYADMVEDLRVFCDYHDLKQVNLCGHSMGGKVAMLFALSYPQIVAKLVVLDIAPIAYVDTHASYIRALLKVNLNELSSRGEADRQLRESIPEIGVRMFLLQSLTGSPGQYSWKLNLPVLLQYMSEIVGFPKVVAAAPVQAMFVAGALSDYLCDEHQVAISSLFPNTQFVSIPEAGHWLHADQPDRVLNILNNFFRE